MHLALLLACFTVAASGADAAEATSAAPSSPEERLAAAQADLEALKLEEAQTSLEQLVADPAASEAVRAKAWLSLGLTRASLLDDDGARVAFAAALTIDGKIALPADSSPKVQRMFEKIRARLPAVDRAAPDATPRDATTPAPGATAASGQPARPPSSSPPSSSLAMPLFIGASAALVLAAAAGMGALVADNALATPEKGRTRPEYDAIKNAGIAAVAAAALFGVTGAALVGIGVLQ